MLIFLEIDDSLYEKAKELKIDLKTFLELKLFEYITGREQLANFKPLRYQEIKPEFERWLKGRISHETARKYFRLLENVDEISVKEISKIYERIGDKNNFSKAVRNLLNFLEDRGLISSKFSQEIKKVIPIRRSQADRQVPSDEDIEEALTNFSRLKDEYRLLVLILLYSGARLRHVIRMLKEFEPRYLTVKGNIARYEIEHLSKGTKSAFYIYMPRWLAEKLRRIEINENGVKSALNYQAKSGKKVSPKYIRKWFNNLLVRLKVDKDVRNFILGRVGEIRSSVEADHYLELLQLADEEYERVLKSFPIKKLGWTTMD
jgi:intergrase/recombinase